MTKALPLLAAIVLVTAGVLIVPRLVHAEGADDFTLRDVNGRLVSLSDYQGYVVVLDFWASWCPPCRQAMPAMQRLHERYGGIGVVILGVNVRDDRDPIDTMRELGVSYPVLRSGDDVADALGVSAIPTIIVLDRHRRIAYRRAGWGASVEGELIGAIDAALLVPAR